MYFLDEVKELKPPAASPTFLMPSATWLIARRRGAAPASHPCPLTSFENMKLTHDKGRLRLLGSGT